MKLKRQNGFTITELLVVFAIIAILVSVTVAAFQNFSNYKRYDYAVATIETALLDTKNAARNSVAGEVHGVKIETNTITVFSGDTYSAIDPNNQVTTFSDITFIPTLTGGTDEIIFSKLNGLPSATGTIEVVGNLHNATTTISVTNAGVIQ